MKYDYRSINRLILVNLRAFLVLGVSVLATTPASASTFTDSFQLAQTPFFATSTPPIVIDLTSVTGPPGLNFLFTNTRTSESALFFSSEVSIATDTFSGLTTKELNSAWMIGDQVLYFAFDGDIGGLTPLTPYYLTGQINPVPIPAAIWLFGTALIGLVGFSKRRKAA